MRIDSVMQPFAALLYKLALAGTAEEQARLLGTFFAPTNTPDRGYALGLLTGDIVLPKTTPAMLRRLIADRMDAELFKLSSKFTSDLGETISLLWPTTPSPQETPPLAEIVDTLQTAKKKDLPDTLARLLDKLPADSRWALLGLMNPAAQNVVSPRLAKQSLAALKPSSLPILEEAWHPPEPPYTRLLGWIDGTAPSPDLNHPARYRPIHRPQIYSPDKPISPDTYSAQALYHGLPVQLVCAEGCAHLYTNEGDNITRALTPHIPPLPENAVFDATLVALTPEGDVMHHDQLTALITSKPTLAKAWANHTVTLFAHDILSHNDHDLRRQPFRTRREILTSILGPATIGLMASQPLAFTDTTTLDLHRMSAPHAAHRGVRLHAWQSLYEETPDKSGHWVWPCDSYKIKAVLLYAKRSLKSPVYDELTFAVWAEDGSLVRLGNGQLKTTADEHAALDKYIKDNTRERFGPVRSVIATAGDGIVLSVTFETLSPSARHKAGFQLSAVSIDGIDWTTPPDKADTLNRLIAMTERAGTPTS